MKKFIVSVIVGVVAVEFLLSYIAFPISNMAILGVCILLTAFLALMGFIIYLLMKDRNRERQSLLERERLAGQERVTTHQTWAALSIAQMQKLDRLLDAGAELRKLPTGETAIVYGDKFVKVNQSEARYFLTGSAE